jgi:hypothetical protein
VHTHPYAQQTTPTAHPNTAPDAPSTAPDWVPPQLHTLTAPQQHKQHLILSTNRFQQTSSMRDDSPIILQNTSTVEEWRSKRRVLLEEILEAADPGAFWVVYLRVNIRLSECEDLEVLVRWNVPEREMRRFALLV